MKMNQPIGNSGYAPLFIRVTLGAYLLIAGLQRIDQIPQFIEEVKLLQMMPNHLAVLFAALVPYLYVVSGVLLIVGIWTTLGALIASLSLIAYMVVFKMFPTGQALHGKTLMAAANALFNKDIIMLAALISLLYSGAGKYSVDDFRKNGG